MRRVFLSCIFISLLAVLASGTALSQDWAVAQKKLRKALKSRDLDTRKQALTELGGFDRPEAVQMIVKAL